MADGGHGVANGAVVVAYLDSTQLLGGFVRALADACRSGLPVALRLGSGYVSTSHGVIDGLRNAAVLLQEEATRARRRADKARALAVTSESQEESDGYAAEAARWTRAAREAEQRLASVTDTVEERPPATFASDISVLRAALGRLATAEERFTRDEYNAFRTVVPDLRLSAQADGSWLASAVVRLPVEGGIAELGPVTWIVEDRGRGTSSAKQALHRPGIPAQVTPELRHRLESLDQLTWQAAKTAANAPFAELPWILLHMLAGEQLPDWVGAPWRDPAFMAHIAATYADPQFAWLGRGQYLRTSPIRQAIVDMAADGDGVTLEELRSVVPWARPSTMWQERREPREMIRAWGPVYERVEATSTRDRHAKAVQCWCGALATTVVRVPEVVGDLLCPRGHAPLAPTGLQRTVVFPEAYQILRVPRERWMRMLATPRVVRHSAPRAPRPSICQLLALLEGHPEGRTSADLAEQLGRTTGSVHNTLNGLAKKGLVRRTATRPCQWLLVEGDRETTDPIPAT